MCYTQEMQKQAAPHKFQGFYPNEQLHIDISYIPYELQAGILYLNDKEKLKELVQEREDAKLKKTKFDYDKAKQIQQIQTRLQHPDYFYTTYDQVHYLKTGKVRYPMLMMQINDPEIRELAGRPEDLQQFLIENKILAADFPKFNDIDCQHITCTCEVLNQYDYEQIFGNHQNCNNEMVILYRTCKRTIFAAAKRQIKSAPTPNPTVVKQFVEFGKRKIDECLGTYLDDFGYSYNQWYNHLNSSKQKNMDRVVQWLAEYPDFDEIINPSNNYPRKMIKEFFKKFHYEGICKKELQGPDGKPRMVCSIPDIVKYVMGPICWKLEEIFTEHLPCYCGGMNLTEMEDKINNYIDQGFELVAEGDGSAFDNTQDVMLKELDRYVYSKVADKVYHVPKSLFLYCAMQYYKIMDIIHVDPLAKKRKTLMTYAVLGTVFSGDCDTTLMNTMRMGLYNWFTNEQAGLKFHHDFICFSKGDDFTVMYHSAYDNTWGRTCIEQAYKKYWLSKFKPKPNEPEYDNRNYGLGQILKFIEFGEPNNIKFCSLRAWYKSPNSNHIYLTRNPEKFYTLGMFSRKLRGKNRKDAIAYLRDQAVALEASYHGIDFFTMIQHKYNQAARQMAENTNINWLNTTPRQADKRKTLSLEVDAFDNEQYFYNKTPRHRLEKIAENSAYWESVKKDMMKHEGHLTQEELQYINQQINLEFDPHEYDLTY